MLTGTGEFLSDGAKIRNLFVVPGAAYGINLDFSYEMPQFPRLGRWRFAPSSACRTRSGSFIVNPIVNISFGPGAEADFAPAARLARNLGEDLFIGLEYYSGKIGNALPLQQQNQQLFPVCYSRMVCHLYFPTRWRLSSSFTICWRQLDGVGGSGGDAMDQRSFIAQCNIDHFQLKLATEQDEAKRQVIARLLAEEQAKLAATGPPPDSCLRHFRGLSRRRGGAWEA
jgi:hypothetical protein